MPRTLLTASTTLAQRPGVALCANPKGLNPVVVSIIDDPPAGPV